MLSMDLVKIQVRANGPLVITGQVELVDSEGKPFPIAGGKPIYLCRCGQSAAKPFCDGAHKRFNFQSDPKAEGPPPA